MSNTVVDTLAGWMNLLPRMTAADDAERITVITLLEQIKSSCAAVQAKMTNEYRESLHAETIAKNRSLDRIDRSIAQAIGLARQSSPWAGRNQVKLATTLSTEMPNTLDALAAGRISEYKATVVVNAAGYLSSADRAELDEEISARLGALGVKALGNTAKGIAYRLDPEGTVARTRRAVCERNVTVRPAPDNMAYLTAMIPMTLAVAAYASLYKFADCANLQGVPGTHSQVMADEFVNRITNGAVVGCDEDGLPDQVGGGIRINLIMTDRALLDGDNEPAIIPGYGPIPASLARSLAYGKAENKVKVWVRRLFTRPDTGQLIAMESHHRLFPPAIRDFLQLRDQTCRTPWCDAPIRHADHITPYRQGGKTVAAQGQGLCENCNLTKETDGWKSKVNPDGGIEITTPTGHKYESPPIPAPRSAPWAEVILGDDPRPTTTSELVGAPV